jgi:3-polyprenyl-4-hydroxybenzoate decarboxylase
MVSDGSLPLNSRAIIDATIPWERRNTFAAPVITSEQEQEVRSRWGHILE